MERRTRPGDLDIPEVQEEPLDALLVPIMWMIGCKAWMREGLMAM